MVKLKIWFNLIDQLFMEEGEVETTRHLPLQCSTIARLKLKHFSNHTSDEPADMAEINISRRSLFGSNF